MSKSVKEKFHKVLVTFMAIVSILLVGAVFYGAYYFVISPTLIAKPAILKPDIPQNALDEIQAGKHIIEEDHLNYLLNELGVYKLPNSETSFPLMELELTDVNKRYYTYIEDNVPITKKGNPKDEDMILKGDQEIILSIINSDNVIQSVRDAKNNNQIYVELSQDSKTLAKKGYLKLYDAFR